MSLLSATASALNDRGAIHQILVSLGVGNNAAHTVQVLADGPARVAVVLVVAFVLTRLVGRASARAVHSLRLVSPHGKGTERGADRARTLAGVFSSILRTIIWVIALLTILGVLGIQLGPFVATATVIGAAVGFGAQTLVKDFLSGVLILAEDQYGVGDNITIYSSKTTGTVESVNLRTTRIRSLDGVIWYVPNGDIRAVGNNTETDSQALVDLVVPHGTDLVHAGGLAVGAASALVTDDTWSKQVSSPPTFVGITDEDSNGVTLRVTIMTKPGQDGPVARQARLLILDAWRAEGIAFEAATANGKVPALVGAPDPGEDADAGAETPAPRSLAKQPDGPPTPRASTDPPRRLKHRPRPGKGSGA